MKYLQRSLSLLLVFVLSFGVFSITANAEDIGTDHLHCYTRAYAYYSSSGFKNIETTFKNGHVGSEIASTTTDYNFHHTSSVWRWVFVVATDDGSLMLKAGQQFTFSMSNLYFYHHFRSGETYLQSGNDIDMFRWRYVYEDGSYSEYFTDLTISKFAENDVYNITVTGKPDKNVRKIDIRAYVYPNTSISTSVKGQFQVTVGAKEGIPFSMSFDVQSEESSWLGSIFNTLGGGFGSIVSGLGELPGKIWGYIEDGLKSLFVPSAEEMTAYYDRWDTLMSERFGALYQIVNIVQDKWDDIMSADETDTVSIPLVTIPLPGDNEFSFGGYDVQIVPDNFSILADGCKVITSIVATFACTNGLRKRYESIFGG